MKITWIRCHTYAEARDFSGVIYLHEWDDKPFYWGKAHNSFFGGHKRKLGNMHASGRYNTGYRHWIEGCLKHGAKLYIGKLDEEALRSINEIENFLIYTCGHVMNTKVNIPTCQLNISHLGLVPASIKNAISSTQP